MIRLVLGLYLLFDCFTHAIRRPSIAFSGRNEYRDRTSDGRNGSLRSNSSSVNLTLNQQSRGLHITDGSNPLVQFSLAVETVAVDQRKDLIWRSMHTPVHDFWFGYVPGSVHDKRERQDTRIEFRKRNKCSLEDWVAFEKVLIATGPIYVVPCHEGQESRVDPVNDFIKAKRRRVDYRGGAECLPGDGSEISIGSVKSRMTVHSEIHSSGTLDFTDLFDSSAMNAVTVRGKDDPAPPSDHDDSRRFQPTKENENQDDYDAEKIKTPIYLRQNDRRSAMGYFDPETGESVSMVDANDFDASYDGETWFHLLGRVCLRGLMSK